jgi:ribosomal protein S13
LVQLTKLDFVPGTSLNNDEISALWDKVDKSKLIQYKLKVELSDDLKELVKIVSGGQTAQGGAA